MKTNSMTLVMLWGIACLAFRSSQAAEMEAIQIAPDGKGFVLATSGRPFVPWGFNYDHDDRGRLLEDYWFDEWETVKEDFREMRDLGANVVRIHLQVARFLEAADRPNERSLTQLAKLVELAEQTGLYLDVTGLGCYHKADVPAWYDNLDEAGRWQAQANFWEAIAKRCTHSPAIFCYDLMNEPVSPAGQRKPGDWLGPPFAGKHFVQVIALEQKERPRAEIARAWIQQLRTAIRKQDTQHLITVGLVDWSLDRPGLTSGFPPDKIGEELDFLCIHLYPKQDKVSDAIETLRAFNIGRPVVIEETFPLGCPLPDFRRFLLESRPHAAGWIGFYWGKTPAQCRESKTIADAIVLAWLEIFSDLRATMTTRP